MTANRQGDWFDGGQYQRLHYHTWTPNDGYTNDAWSALYQGVNLATNSLEDLEGITDPGKFSMTQAELDDMTAELHTLRAWLYIRLFDLYRNIEIITKVKGESQGVDRSTPEETFAFIEKELNDAIPKLPTNDDLALMQSGDGRKAALLLCLYAYI